MSRIAFDGNQRRATNTPGLLNVPVNDPFAVGSFLIAALYKSGGDLQEPVVPAEFGIDGIMQIAAGGPWYMILSHIVEEGDPTSYDFDFGPDGPVKAYVNLIQYGAFDNPPIVYPDDLRSNTNVGLHAQVEFLNIRTSSPNDYFVGVALLGTPDPIDVPVSPLPMTLDMTDQDTFFGWGSSMSAHFEAGAENVTYGPWLSDTREFDWLTVTYAFQDNPIPVVPNVLLPDDSTFENGLGFWRISRLNGHIDRVVPPVGPVPHAGSAVMRMIQVGGGAPDFSPTLISGPAFAGGGFFAEEPYAYCVNPGETATFTFWARSDPDNPVLTEDAYGAEIYFQLEDDTGRDVATADFGTFPISNNYWTPISVTITGPPGTAPYHVIISINWRLRNNSRFARYRWNDFPALPFTVYISDCVFSGSRLALEAPLPELGTGNIKTLHQYDASQIQFDNQFNPIFGIVDLGPKLAITPSLVGGASSLKNVYTLDKTDYSLSPLMSFNGECMTSGPDGHIYFSAANAVAAFEADGTSLGNWFVFPSGFGFVNNIFRFIQNMAHGRDGSIYCLATTGTLPTTQTVLKLTQATQFPSLLPSPWVGFGEAMKFQGGGVNCGPWDGSGPPAISGVGVAAAFTLEARVQMLVAAGGAICGWFNIDQPPQLFGGFSLEFFWTDDTGAGFVIVDPGGTLGDLAPHVVAADYDGTTMRLYIDGAVVASQATTGIASFNPGDNFWIGNDDEGEALQAVIDEVRWSNVARYAGAYTPSPTPFVADAHTLALYHLDSVSDNTTPDASSGSHTGALTSSAIVASTQITALNETSSAVSYQGIAVGSDGTVWVLLDPSGDRAQDGNNNVVRQYKPSTGQVTDIAYMPRVDIWLTNPHWADGYAYDGRSGPFSGREGITEALCGLFVDNQDNLVIPLWTFTSQQFNGSNNTQGYRTPVLETADHTWFVSIASDGTVSVIGGWWDDTGISGSIPPTHVQDGAVGKSMGATVTLAGLSFDRSLLYFIDSSDMRGFTSNWNLLRSLSLGLASIPPLRLRQRGDSAVGGGGAPRVIRSTSQQAPSAPRVPGKSNTYS